MINFAAFDLSVPTRNTTPSPTPILAFDSDKGKVALNRRFLDFTPVVYNDISCAYIALSALNQTKIGAVLYVVQRYLLVKLLGRNINRCWALKQNLQVDSVRIFVYNVCLFYDMKVW